MSSKPIQQQNFVPREQIKTYQEIDALEVMEELLLFKGIEVGGENRCVHKKYLDDMALVHYSLKVNATNRLYVGLHLDRSFQKLNPVTSSGKIKIPMEIWEKVKAIHSPYKNQSNEQ